MTLPKNPLLQEIDQTAFEGSDFFNLQEWFSERSLLGPLQLPPMPMFVFDKDSFINAILRYIAWQLINIPKSLFTFFKCLDDILCESPQRLDAVLFTQVIFHLSKASLSEVTVEKVLLILFETIHDILRASTTNTFFLTNEFPAATGQSITVNDVKNFLRHPIVLRTFSEQLQGFSLANVSIESIEMAIEKMNIYVTEKTLLGFRGWTVLDGIVVVQGELAQAQYAKLADILTLSLHETSHFLLRYFANDFMFSSPQKQLDGEYRFKDPLIEGKGLELGRSVELALFSMQVSWKATDKMVAENFVTRALDQTTTEFLSEEDKRQLKQREGVSASSGFDISSWMQFQFTFC